MCFGNTQTSSQDKSFDPNPTVAGGATGNINFVQNLENQGPQAYNGQFVAPFSGQQQTSFNQANNLSNTPLVGQAQQDITNYGAAPASSVNANTISSAMNPYMSQYVQQSLAPQLENWQQNVAQQNKGAAANSTMAGAFGNDAQDALYRSNLTNQQNIGLTGLVGNAYNAAFNTAIGAGAQDVSNNLNAQTTNANLNEQALNRQMGAAQGLQGLIGTQSNLANLENSFGQQQTAASQAGLNAQYSDWLRQQQQPYQAAALMNQTVSAGSQAMPASQQTQNYAPNNSGYALAGAIGPALLGFADGGEPPVGIPSMVGERGPELFQPHSGDPASVVGAGGPSFMTPNQPGTVIPNEQIAGGNMPNVPPTGALPSQTLNGAAGLPPTGMMPTTGGPSPTGMMPPAPSLGGGGPIGSPTAPNGQALGGGGPIGSPIAPSAPTAPGIMPPAPGPTTAPGVMPTAPQGGMMGAVGGAPPGFFNNADGSTPSIGLPPGMNPDGSMQGAPPAPGGSVQPTGMMPPAGGAPLGGGGPIGSPTAPTAPGVMPTAPNGPTGVMPTAPGGPALGGGGPIGSPTATGQPALGGGGPIGSPTTGMTNAQGPGSLLSAVGAPSGQMPPAPPVSPTGMMPPAPPTTAPGVMPTTNNVTPIRPTGMMNTAPQTGMSTAFGQAA